MIRTGVLVGRFQTPYLTEGHKYMIRYGVVHYNKLVVVIGDSPTRLTTKHPLPFESRKRMVEDYTDRAIVLRLADCKSDEIWSKNLDKLLFDYENVTLYGSRDSFLPYYSGKHRVVELQAYGDSSATKLRSNVQLGYSTAFREGMIYAVNSKFPTVYPTVDILVRKNDKVLLGRKKGFNQWVVPGGFVDPTDSCLEAAARRELSEEVGSAEFSTPKYKGSFKIDDWRYRGTSDGIMTTLFEVNYIFGIIKAGDDLESVAWFTKQEALEIINDSHKILIEQL